MRSRQGTHPAGQAEQGHLAALESAGHVRDDESTHVYERIRYMTTVGSGPDPLFDAGPALLRMGIIRAQSHDPETLPPWISLMPELGKPAMIQTVARIVIFSALTAAAVILPALPAVATAPTSASCAGQFFSSHAGLAAQHGEPRNVGEFTSAAARERWADFGASISGSRDLPRENCGL